MYLPSSVEDNLKKVTQSATGKYELPSISQSKQNVQTVIDYGVNSVADSASSFMKEFAPDLAEEIRWQASKQGISLQNVANRVSSKLGDLATSQMGGGSIFGGSSGSNWALCLSDGTVIEFQSILQIDVDSSNQVMQSPTEQGSFVMYNKAISPTTVSLQAAVQGDDAKRARVTQLLMNLVNTNELLTLVTPEMEFSDYNLESVQYSRKPDDGLNIIYFDLSLIEVRQVSSQYGDAKVATKVNKGKQNGSQSILSSVTGGLLS